MLRLIRRLRQLEQPGERKRLSHEAQDAARRTAHAQEILAESAPLTMRSPELPVRYLVERRGITRWQPHALRWHPACPWGRERVGCIVVPVSNVDGDVTGIWRIRPSLEGAVERRGLGSVLGGCARVIDDAALSIIARCRGHRGRAERLGADHLSVLGRSLDGRHGGAGAAGCLSRDPDLRRRRSRSALQPPNARRPYARRRVARCGSSSRSPARMRTTCSGRGGPRDGLPRSVRRLCRRRASTSSRSRSRPRTSSRPWPRSTGHPARA